MAIKKKKNCLGIHLDNQTILCPCTIGQQLLIAFQVAEALDQWVGEITPSTLSALKELGRKEGRNLEGKGQVQESFQTMEETFA